MGNNPTGFTHINYLPLSPFIDVADQVFALKMIAFMQAGLPLYTQENFQELDQRQAGRF